MLGTETPRPGDYVFMRVPQWSPDLETGKRLADRLRCIPDVVLIPEFETIDCYEDKIRQTQLYEPWMPLTYLLTATNRLDDAINAAGHLGFPFISKGSVASASVNVRLVKTLHEAVTEFKEAMSGDGLPMRAGGKDLRQKGYLLWQRFLKGNDYDYRACINGRLCMLLRRYNRDDKPFASGSGKTEPITELTTETRVVLNTAFNFFRQHGMKWCGIDLVRDPSTGEWKVLETTLGWSLRAYHECVYFTRQAKKSQYRGADWADLLLDEIEAGVFR
jgi:glutathione synthase/RimK-type ligase-like ATP-grasp enzyme